MLRASARLLAGDIEGGAVIDRGADDGDAERDVDGALEVDELHGDVALVVIHRDDKIKLTAKSAHKDGVRASAAGAVDAATLRFVDGGSDDLGILVPEEVVFAGVGIQAADGDARCMLEHQAHRLGAEFDGAHDALLLDFARLLERDVSGDMDGGKLFADE